MESYRAAAPPIAPSASLAQPGPPLRELIIARLHTICDPQTNLSIVQLGMVDEVSVAGQRVLIVCRCPHTWYTTDTSIALIGEIQREVGAVPGAWMVDVVLLSEGSSGQPTPWAGLAQPVDEPELALS